MIAQAELIAGQRDLLQLATSTEVHIADLVKDEKQILPAIRKAQQVTPVYYQKAHRVFDETLKDIGEVAARKYIADFDMKLSDDDIRLLVSDLIDTLRAKPYHGLNYGQRLGILGRQLDNRLNKSGQVGQTLETRLKNLSRAYSETYPFGAQVHLDQRFLLSEAVRLEHNLARHLITKAGGVLVKWQTSDSHNHHDICDELEASIQKDVVHYLEERKIKLNPRGIYFVNEAPPPPHPNCQCTLLGIAGDKVQRRKAERNLKQLRKVLKRIIGRKK